MDGVPVSLTPDQIAQQYPAFLPLLQIPEIAALLTTASQGNWSAAQLQEHLMASQWWKTTSATARQWTVLELSDPAEAARQKGAAAQQYWNIAAQEGIGMSISQMNTLLEKGLSEGWTAQQAQQAIVGYAHNGEHLSGGIQSTQDALKATASDYGMSVSDQTLFGWAQKIQAGTSTTDAFKDYAMRQAKSMFPTLSAAIDSGQTVREYADPYAQAAASTLGINANDVNFTQDKWRSLLQTRGTDGKLAPLSLADAQTKLMSDPVYGFDKTTNAMAAADQLKDGIAQTMGKAA